MQILPETSCIENGWILLNRLCVVIILCSVPAVGLFFPTYKACVIIFLSLFQVKYQRHDLCKKYYREEEQYMGRRFPLLLRVLQLVLWELKIINTRLLEWNILQKVVVKYFITSCKQEGEWAYNLNCEAQRTFSVILVQNSLVSPASKYQGWQIKRISLNTWTSRTSRWPTKASTTPSLQRCLQQWPLQFSPSLVCWVSQAVL